MYAVLAPHPLVFFSFCFISSQPILFAFLSPFVGYGKTISHVVIGLKTTKGTKQLKVG